jgi:uncharacterized membrane protein YoaK (UPF0700 family)
VLLLAYAIIYALHPRSVPAPLVYPLIALLGLAMGLQGAAAMRLGIPGVVTTVVTGTLTSLLTGLMKMLHLRSDPGSEKPVTPARYGLQAIVVVTYCGGAAVSGLLMARASALAGFFPVTVVAVVIAVRLLRRDFKSQSS